MRVKISYTVEVNDKFRKAFRLWIADITDSDVVPGLATRAEIRQHFERYGSLHADDIKNEVPGAEAYLLV